MKTFDQMIADKQAERRPLLVVENKLRLFHQAIGATIGETPAVRDPELRARLIVEEACETAIALLKTDKEGSGVEAGLKLWDIVEQSLKTCLANGKLNDEPDQIARLAEVIDGMCDLVYVTSGTAVVCGTPLDPFFDEVHRSNMQKVGGPIVDGKQMKPRNWRPPQIRDLLDRLRPEITKELKECNQLPALRRS